MLSPIPIRTSATSDDELARAIARRLTPIDLRVPGINRAMRPLDYGCSGLADARAYHERLAARGERDES